MPALLAWLPSCPTPGPLRPLSPLTPPPHPSLIMLPGGSSIHAAACISAETKDTWICLFTSTSSQGLTPIPARTCPPCWRGRPPPAPQHVHSRLTACPRQSAPLRPWPLRATPSPRLLSWSPHALLPSNQPQKRPRSQALGSGLAVSPAQLLGSLPP